MPRSGSGAQMHRSPMFSDPLRGAHRTLPGAVSVTEGGAAAGFARYAVGSVSSTGALALAPAVQESRPGLEVEPHIGVMDTELSTVGEVVEVSPHRGDMMTNQGWMVTDHAVPALQTYAATVVAPSLFEEEEAVHGAEEAHPELYRPLPPEPSQTAPVQGWGGESNSPSLSARAGHPPVDPLGEELGHLPLQEEAEEEGL